MRDLGRQASAFLLATALPLLAVAKSVPHGGRSASQSNPPPATQPDRGQKVFEQNCSRCHNAPEGFSPRIAGAIARHMRMRAELSDEDYKELRRFLAP
ncbi:MAG TPA: cytochrome c [Terracidiphilus sp.]|nr:cytochrome c [Terracidiphilus sp.]